MNLQTLTQFIDAAFTYLLHVEEEDRETNRSFEEMRTEHNQLKMDTDRTIALHNLGTKYIGHPMYKFDPRHSNDTAIYPHFRQPYLDEIRDAAEVARRDNPAHLRHAAKSGQYITNDAVIKQAKAEAFEAAAKFIERTDLGALLGADYHKFSRELVLSYAGVIREMAKELT